MGVQYRNVTARIRWTDYAQHIIIVIRKRRTCQGFLCYSFSMRKVVPWGVGTIVLWTGIPLCWQPLSGQPPGVGVESSHKPEEQTKFSTGNTNNDQRGSKSSPVVVEAQNRPKNSEDAAQEKAEKDRKDRI